MHNTLLIAILAGLGGMIGWGSADFFAKKTVDRLGAIKGLVWAHCFGTGLFIVIELIRLVVTRQVAGFPASAGGWLGLAGFGVLQMVVYWLAYEAFEKGQVAVLNPIFAAYSGVVALVSVIALGEHLNGLLAVALVVLFAGTLFMNLDIEGLKSRSLKVIPGLREIAAATALAAVWTLGWNKFVSGHDAVSYALAMYAFMTLAALVLARLMRVALQGVPKDMWKFLAAIGAGETLAYLAITWGYSSTSRTSVVALISGAFSIPTVILAYMFLQERLSKLQLGAVVLIVLGIIGISLA